MHFLIHSKSIRTSNGDEKTTSLCYRSTYKPLCENELICAQFVTPFSLGSHSVVSSPSDVRKGKVCQSFDEMLREGRGGGVLQVRPRQKESWFLLRVGAAGRVGLSRRAAFAPVTPCVTPVSRILIRWHKIKVAINNIWLNVETVIILISCT